MPAVVVSGDTGVNTDDRLRYVGERTSSGLVIRPRDPYLDLLRDGGKIEPLNYLYTPWERTFCWPDIDVKVVNNTGQTVLFHEAVFQVRRSSVDLRPIPVLAGPSYKMQLPLVNLGWGPMRDNLLTFGLAADDEIEPIPEIFKCRFSDPGELRTKDFLAPYLAEAGMNLDLFQYWRSAQQDREIEDLRQRALGPFVRGYAYLIGTLTFTQTNLEGKLERRSHPIKTTISFDGPPGAIPQPSTGTYQVRLRSEGNNYTVRTPISQQLATGDADRFRFSVAADRSSIHDLTMSLLYNGTSTTEPSPISLELFVSKADIEYQLTPSTSELQAAFVNPPTMNDDNQTVDRSTAATLLAERAASARALSQYAAHLASQGHTDMALTYSRSAVDELRKIAAADRRERSSFGRALHRHATLLADAAQLAKARFALQEAIVVYKKLTSAHPGYGHLLAKVEADLASLEAP